MHPSADDHRFMAAAIRLARKHEGWTATNPSVACLLVKDEGNGPAVIGSGVTAIGGRPHAEPLALAQAGDRARGSTAYVTLEPCAHHGRTPPCAQTLIDAGVARGRHCRGRSRRARQREGPRHAARRRHRGARGRSGANEARIGLDAYLVHKRLGPALRHLEAGGLRRRADRAAGAGAGRDHRRDCPRAEPSDARAPPRDPHRQRHRAGRRSRTHLPSAGACQPARRCASCWMRAAACMPACAC